MKTLTAAEILAHVNARSIQWKRARLGFPAVAHVAGMAALVSTAEVRELAAQGLVTLPNGDGPVELTDAGRGALAS